MANFHIDSALQNSGDVLKSYQWTLDIPQLDKVVTNLDVDGFKVRCRSAQLPGRSIQPIESYYLGMKQMFAGRVNFNGSFPVVLEEFEDQKVIQSLYEWHQKIFDVDPASATAGGSQVMFKRQTLGLAYSTDIFLTLLKYNNESLSKKYRLYNAWPLSMEDVGLDYAGNDSVKINVTFAYDFWVLI